MVGTQQQDENARAVQRELDRRNLSILGASDVVKIERNTLTRMARGNRPALETVEKFARNLGLDVNEWRERFGYPRVEPPFPYNRHEAAGLARLKAEYGQEARIVYVPADPDDSEEAVRQNLADAERGIRKRLGLPEDGGIFTKS